MARADARSLGFEQVTGYFKSMELRAASNELFITNEGGQRYAVDLGNHQVRAAP